MTRRSFFSLLAAPAVAALAACKSPFPGRNSGRSPYFTETKQWGLEPYAMGFDADPEVLRQDIYARSLPEHQKMIAKSILNSAFTEFR
jgi:hypothetical protein